MHVGTLRRSQRHQGTLGGRIRRIPHLLPSLASSYDTSIRRRRGDSKCSSASNPQSITGTANQDAEPPQIAASGTNVYILWHEFPTPGRPTRTSSSREARTAATRSRPGPTSATVQAQTPATRTWPSPTVTSSWSGAKGGGADILFRRSTNAARELFGRTKAEHRGRGHPPTDQSQRRRCVRRLGGDSSRGHHRRLSRPQRRPWKHLRHRDERLQHPRQLGGSPGGGLGATGSSSPGGTTQTRAWDSRSSSPKESSPAHRCVQGTRPPDRRADRERRVAVNLAYVGARGHAMSTESLGSEPRAGGYRHPVSCCGPGYLPGG